MARAAAPATLAGNPALATIAVWSHHVLITALGRISCWNKGVTIKQCRHRTLVSLSICPRSTNFVFLRTLCNTSYRWTKRSSLWLCFGSAQLSTIRRWRHGDESWSQIFFPNATVRDEQREPSEARQSVLDRRNTKESTKKLQSFCSPVTGILFYCVSSNSKNKSVYRSAREHMI